MRSVSLVPNPQNGCSSVGVGAVSAAGAEAQWARLSDCLDPRSPFIVQPHKVREGGARAAVGTAESSPSAASAAIAALT